MKKLIPIIFLLSVVFVSCKKSHNDDPAPQAQPQQKPIPVQPIEVIQVDSINVSFTLHSNRVPYWFYRRVGNKFITTEIHSNDTIIKDKYQKDNDIYKNIVTMQTSGKLGDFLSIDAEYRGKKAHSETKNDGVYFAWVAQENYK